MSNKIKPIYIKDLFKSKSNIGRFIPNFIFSWLEKLIHQNEINEFIDKYGDRQGLEFSDSMLEFLDVNYHICGKENLPPKDGRYIFVANHPFGGPDGIVLISMLGRFYDKLKFPVNDLLLNLKNLNNIFLGVNKHGAQARKDVLAMEEAFASDCQMIMFPAGLVSRKQGKVIKDLEWQKSFITKAIYHKRDIIPIYIDGQNSDFFYRLAAFRKLIGLKVNIEMLLLPKETFKKRHTNLTMHIGKPIPWQTFDSSKKTIEWAQWVKEICIKTKN